MSSISQLGPLSPLIVCKRKSAGGNVLTSNNDRHQHAAERQRVKDIALRVTGYAPLNGSNVNILHGSQQWPPLISFMP